MVVRARSPTIPAKPNTPIRPVARRRTQGLPAELTRFVGREAEVADCVALLTQHRLLTLTGPGGIGKSRLGAQVARRSAGSFPDGVYLVDLGPLEDPMLVARAVSTAVGLAGAAGECVTDL